MMIPPLDNHYFVKVRHRRQPDGELGYSSPSWIRKHWPGAKLEITAGDNDGLDMGYKVGYLTRDRDDLTDWHEKGTVRVAYDVVGFESDDALAALVADPARLAALLLSPVLKVRQAAILATGGA